MSYVRKTKDIFNILGNYGYSHGWEVVTCEETRREARKRLIEYRQNEPGIPFKVKLTREPIEVK